MPNPNTILAARLVEITFALLLMAFFLALTLPRLGPDPYRRALTCYALLALVPTLAIAYGSLRQRPSLRLVAWSTLLLLTAAAVSG